MQITKFYSIENWTEYTEVEKMGDVSSMEPIEIRTIVFNRPTMITTWLNDDGVGFEKRTYTVASGETA